MTEQREVKSFFEELGIDNSEQMAAEATHEAIAEAHAHGLPVTVDVNGVMSRVFPDGRVEQLESSTTSSSMELSV